MPSQHDFISFGNINKKSLSYLSQAREGIIIMEIIKILEK
jgi:hypothetical protein